MLGKPVGSDQALQKATGASLMGLEQAKALAAELIDSALEEIKIFGTKGEHLAALARYVIEREK